jgi:hypothetical protein
MPLPKISRISTIWDTKHKYKTIADIKNLTPNQIFNIDPEDIRDDICYNDCIDSNQLNRAQQIAVKFVLDKKREGMHKDDMHAERKEFSYGREHLLDLEAGKRRHKKTKRRKYKKNKNKYTKKRK